jgi:hypothetical protein
MKIGAIRQRLSGRGEDQLHPDAIYPFHALTDCADFHYYPYSQLLMISMSNLKYLEFLLFSKRNTLRCIPNRRSVSTILL